MCAYNAETPSALLRQSVPSHTTTISQLDLCPIRSVGGTIQQEHDGGEDNLLRSGRTAFQYNIINSPYASAIERLSFFALILYFAFQPFIDSLCRLVFLGSFLVVSWGVVFLVFVVCYVLIGKSISWTFELKTVVAFHIYLGFCTVYTLVVDGGDSVKFYDAVYQVRDLVWSVPLFMLLVIRGLKAKELSAILTVFMFMIPFAILLMYRDSHYTSLQEVQQASLVGARIPYNSFVPYTTFPLFVALYLTTKMKNRLLRILMVCLLVILLLFIFASPSRQSVVFVIIGFATTIALSKNARKLMLVTSVGAAVTIILVATGLVDHATSRFFSSQLTETTRTDLMAGGFNYFADPWVWFFGNGLSWGFQEGKNLVWNPHNSYIFSMMRTGLVGMILMFLPFIVALIKLVKLTARYGDEPWYDRDHASLVAISLLFTLFHSFFGYPHIDAISSPIVWFGLSLWIVFREGIVEQTKANDKRSPVRRTHQR